MDWPTAAVLITVALAFPLAELAEALIKRSSRSGDDE